MSDFKWNNTKLVACTIDLTEACNLACTYCFTWGKTKKKLSFEMGKRIIDFFYDWTEPNEQHYEISFWGGEPLLEFPLMTKLIEYSQSKPLGSKTAYGGTTNGLLLDEYKLIWMRENKAKFMISIDGVKEVHDQFRVYPNGHGSWDDLAKKIPIILKYWPDARFRLSLTSTLIPYFMKSIEWLYNEGVRWIAFSPVFEEDWSDDKLKELEEQLIHLSEFINSHPGFFCHHMTDPGRGIWQQYPCGAGRSYVGFSTEGKIYPCHRFNKYGDTPENIKKREEWCIGDIETGFNKKRQQFLDYPERRKQDCGECEIYRFCAGGCYAVHADLGDNGIFSIIDKFCKFNELLFGISNNYVIQQPNPIQKLNSLPCICYNMCYQEGSDEEIFYRDKKSNLACTCYNTTYSGPINPPNTRKLIND